MSGLGHDLIGGLVRAQAAPARVAEHPVTRPLAERDLADEPRRDPVRAFRVLPRDFRFPKLASLYAMTIAEARPQIWKPFAVKDPAVLQSHAPSRQVVGN